MKDTILQIPNYIKLKLKSPYDLGLLAAEIIKKYSHDPKTQTGAAIIDSEYNLYGVGSNCYPFPKNITLEDQLNLHSNNFDNEHRYRLEHAERNSIAFAIRNGNMISGKTMTVSYTPCVNCANSIVNFGLKEVVDSSIPDFTHHRWGKDWEYVVKDLLPRSGVKYTNYTVDPKVRDKVLFRLENLIDRYYLHLR